MNNLTVSVVIPAHAAVETIGRCLDAVLHQSSEGIKLETVVVLDGPNEKLYKIIKGHEARFAKKGQDLRIFQLPVNRGVFKAILEGVTQASGEWVVIIGERCILGRDYLKTVTSLNECLIIPETIEENWQDSPINTTLYLLRKKIYRLKEEKNKNVYITETNFEHTAKGTGGLWTKKDLYLKACSRMKNGRSDKHISDDTKLLKELIALNGRILKSREARILYIARTELLKQLKHIYNRGPKFINYYLRPNTRFFWPLVITIILPILIMISFVVNTQLLFLWLGILVLVETVLCIYFADTVRQLLVLVWTIPLMALTFYSGILKGLLLAIKHGKN